MAEPLKWILIGSGCLLIIGLILTVIILKEMKKRDDRKMKYATKVMLPEIRRTLLETMGQSMDMIPAKLSEIRRTMEE